MAGIASDMKASTAQAHIVQEKTNTVATGLGNIIKVLPTGTYFLFTFLNPILTNEGECQKGHKYATSIFIALCGFACFFSWFTDSYVDNNGVKQYGIVTTKGLFCLSDSESCSVDLSKYKLRLGDFVHALLSVTVFGLVALWDANTVDCFYPAFDKSQKSLAMALPPIIGAVVSSAFVTFPNKRYGIGHPTSNASPPKASSPS